MKRDPTSMDDSDIVDKNTENANMIKAEGEISIPDQLPPPPPHGSSSGFLDSTHQPNAFDSRLMMSRQSAGGSDYDYVSHLASSGLAGMAAAAAISTSQRKSALYSFEPVPALRKRHSTRILRKIQQLVDEFSVRVGQQVCLVVCSPKSAFKSALENSHGGNCSNNVHFKVFGASPLERVMRNLKDVIVNNLENSLQTCNFGNNPTGHVFTAPGMDVLPPLLVDGIPTPLDKMTQAQLRAFIPVMLKYSTGRTKPAWGRNVSRPPWWPEDVPWANVRSDVRTDEEKQRQSWTNALRKVVRCCYEYHGKAHYLYDYNSDVSGVQRVVEGFSQQHPSTIEMEAAAAASINHHHHGHHHHHIPPTYEFAEQMVVDKPSQSHYSGRHMLINEQEAVEAQLRAINSYNMNDARMGGGGMRLENQAAYANYSTSMASECDNRRIKIENYALEQQQQQQQQGSMMPQQFLKKDTFTDVLDPAHLVSASKGGPSRENADNVGQ